MGWSVLLAGWLAAGCDVHLPSDPPASTPAPSPGGGGGGDASAILARDCAWCHTGPRPAANIDLTTGTYRPGVLDSIGNGVAWEKAPFIARLATADKRTLLDWVVAYTDQDGDGRPRAAVVNETFARRFWPGQSAVGKRFSLEGVTGPWVDVVGVIRDGKYFSLSEEPSPFVFLNLRPENGSYLTLLVRTASEPQSIIGALRNETISASPTVVTELRSIQMLLFWMLVVALLDITLTGSVRLRYWRAATPPEDLPGELADYVLSDFPTDETEAVAAAVALAADAALCLLREGAAVAMNRYVEYFLYPYIVMFQSLPKVALAPLFVLWFGLGIESKIALAAVLVLFLVFLNTYAGVREVDQDLIDGARLMRATRAQVITKVIIPSSMSWVFAAPSPSTTRKAGSSSAGWSSARNSSRARRPGSPAWG